MLTSPGPRGGDTTILHQSIPSVALRSTLVSHLNSSLISCIARFIGFREAVFGIQPIDDEKSNYLRSTYHSLTSQCDFICSSVTPRCIISLDTSVRKLISLCFSVQLSRSKIKFLCKISYRPSRRCNVRPTCPIEYRTC